MLLRELVGREIHAGGNINVGVAVWWLQQARALEMPEHVVDFPEHHTAVSIWNATRDQKNNPCLWGVDSAIALPV